ncbi:hypothetical protein ACIBHX_04915 [Nonomuraea sp. NPDC050536]|uniref:hypothetical protein n=1 Tax=Nonomuraea sp. NPDC050536 TaxID=3364366 RepID=UPI0037C731DB
MKGSHAVREGADGAYAHVLARAGGPVGLGAGVAAPAGMARLTYDDSTGVGVPVWPDGVTPSLLEEYQVAGVSVERAGESRRVLAACLKCCWTDLSADPWPGSPAPLDQVLDTYRALIGRTDDLMRNWAIGALRRLHDSGWVVMRDGVVRLGPRCATWPVESYALLKELLRRLPEPDRTGLITTLPTGNTAPAEDTTSPPAADTAPANAEDAGSAPNDDITPTHAKQGLPVEVVPAQAADAETALRGDAGAEQVEGAGVASRDGVGAESGRVEGAAGDFEDLLGGFDERRRAELVAAFMAVECAGEPVPEARFGALRDPALRHTLGEMLARRGRVLVQHRERWISGYADEFAKRVEGPGLSEAERAVLTLVLVHSVAIPRAEGMLPEDSWLSPHPTAAEELRRHTQLPIGELEGALRTLRHAGLLGQVKAGEEAGGYVPGPQFHRLTPAARRRLQEELILAAGPHTPLAAAVRAKRSSSDPARRTARARSSGDVRPAESETVA